MSLRPHKQLMEFSSGGIGNKLCYANLHESVADP